MRSWAETTSYWLPQISQISTDFFDLLGLGVKVTQISQMTQILTCSVWDFADFGRFCWWLAEFFALFLVVSKKKRIFAAEVLNIEGIDYEKYE